MLAGLVRERECLVDRANAQPRAPRLSASISASRPYKWKKRAVSLADEAVNTIAQFRFARLALSKSSA